MKVQKDTEKKNWIAVIGSKNITELILLSNYSYPYHKLGETIVRNHSNQEIPNNPN